MIPNLRVEQQQLQHVNLLLLVQLSRGMRPFARAIGSGGGWSSYCCR